jgi:hypothetical protein
MLFRSAALIGSFLHALRRRGSRARAEDAEGVVDLSPTIGRLLPWPSGRRIAAFHAPRTQFRSIIEEPFYAGEAGLEPRRPTTTRRATHQGKTSDKPLRFYGAKLLFPLEAEVTSRCAPDFEKRIGLRTLLVVVAIRLARGASSMPISGEPDSDSHQAFASMPSPDMKGTKSSAGVRIREHLPRARRVSSRDERRGRSCLRRDDRPWA